MKLLRKKSVLGVLALLALKVIKGGVCPKNHFIVVDDKGITLKCLECNYCPIGYGLQPRCGSTLTKTKFRGIDCEPCVNGKTYSDEHGPSSCKSCAICAPKEVVWNKCTEEKNANCSGSCVKNYYFDSRTHDCQPCSYCCGDKNDVIENECVDHGLPKQRRCSFINTALCSPTTTATRSSTSTTKQTVFINTSIVPKMLTNETKASQTNHIVIVSVTTGSIIFLLITISSIFWYFKSRRKAAAIRHIDSTENETQLEISQAREIPGNYPIRRNIDHIYGEAMNQVNNDCDTCDALRQVVKVQIDLPQNCVEGEEEVRIQCHLEEEQNHEILNDKFVYTWFKDNRKLENEHSKILTFEELKMSDFGRLRCQVECKDHAAGVQAAPESKEVFLDVFPGLGKTHTKLFHLEHLKNDVFKGVIIAVAGAPSGLWRNIAAQYGLNADQMNMIALKEIKDNDIYKAAEETFNVVQTIQPGLTVYQFCKFMKEKCQNDIVEKLEPYLTSAENVNGANDNQSYRKDNTDVEGRQQLNAPAILDTPKINRLLSVESTKSTESENEETTSFI